MSYRKHHVKNKIHKLKPKKHFYKMPIFWWSILVVFIVCLAVYLFLFLPQIQVNNILVSGNNKIQTDEIKNIALKEINKNMFGFAGVKINTKSILLINSSNIQNDILVKFSKISEVKVSRKFPDTLNVIIQERVPVAIFCGNPSEISGQALLKDCYFMDEAGIIFESVDSEFVALENNYENNFAIIRQEIKSGQVSIGEQVINKTIIDAILNSEKMLKDNYKISITDALVTTPIRLNIKTSENWQIYLDLQGDTNLQIAKLNLLLKNQISENDRKALQYIDMRFKDRAYYK